MSRVAVAVADAVNACVGDHDDGDVNDDVDADVNVPAVHAPRRPGESAPRTGALRRDHATACGDARSSAQPRTADHVGPAGSFARPCGVDGSHRLCCETDEPVAQNVDVFVVVFVIVVPHALVDGVGVGDGDADGDARRATWTAT